MLKLRVQQGIDLIGGDAQDSFFFGDQAFVGHIHGDLHGRFGGALAVAGLEHPQLAALDGELDILHILVVLLQAVGDVEELLVNLGHFFSSFEIGLGVADTGHNIFTLGIEQVIAVHFFSPVAGLRVKATPVPESQPMLPKTMVWILTAVPRSWGCRRAAVIDGALAVPGFEDGFGCQAQLLVGDPGGNRSPCARAQPGLNISVRLSVFGGQIGISLVRPSCALIFEGIFEKPHRGCPAQPSRTSDQAAV
jgi:hypothetical protein